jgi:hypothetical protein
VKRPKHKAPVLFGERMRLVIHSHGRTLWCRVYGDLTAYVEHMPGDGTFPWRSSFASRECAPSDTQAAAVSQLETLIRKTGRALPWVATVSRKFARSHGR